MTQQEIYQKLANIPPTALRAIQAGRLKGKSDINPQWRYEIMTEVFGLCGIGWKYAINTPVFKEDSTGQVAVFVEVLLWVKVNDQWSDAIPGSGGSMFITNESKGLYTSDEAIKMATTDALGVAMKMIGVAGDVYRGKTSHHTQPQTKYEQPTQPEPKKLPELKESTKEYLSAIQWVKAGGTDEEREKLADKIGAKYTMSREIRTSVINAAKAIREAEAKKQKENAAINN